MTGTNDVVEVRGSSVLPDLCIPPSTRRMPLADEYERIKYKQGADGLRAQCPACNFLNYIPFASDFSFFVNSTDEMCFCLLQNRRL